MKIEPVEGWLLVDIIDTQKEKQRTTKTGIIVPVSDEDMMRKSSFTIAKVIIGADEFQIGDIIGINKNTERGVGITDKFLVNRNSVVFKVFGYEAK